MDLENKDYLEIELEYNEILALIKRYYEDNYSVKSCKVDIHAENIIDKLKEIDLFHRDKPFYNIIFRTTVSGKIKDKEGNYNNYKEILNEQGTKQLVRNALQCKFDFEDIKIAYNFFDNRDGGMSVKISHMIGKIDKKALIKRFK